MLRSEAFPLASPGASVSILEAMFRSLTNLNKGIKIMFINNIPLKWPRILKNTGLIKFKVSFIYIYLRRENV